MHAFNIQLVGWNQACVSGLSSNFFFILRNIPTAVGIVHRGVGCKCIIYVWLVLIDLCICNKIFYGVCVWCKGMIPGESFI